MKYLSVGLGALAAMLSLYNTNPKKVEPQYNPEYVQEWHDTKESVYDLSITIEELLKIMCSTQ